RDGTLDRLHGFGPRLRERLWRSIETLTGAAPRRPLAVARKYAARLARHPPAAPGVLDVLESGACRRQCSSLGSVDLVVVTQDNLALLRRLYEHRRVVDLSVRGTHRIHVRLLAGDGLPLDARLRVAVPAHQAVACFIHTGSRAHVAGM